MVIQWLSKLKGATCLSKTFTKLKKKISTECEEITFFTILTSMYCAEEMSTGVSMLARANTLTAATVSGSQLILSN